MKNSKVFSDEMSFCTCMNHLHRYAIFLLLIAFVICCDGCASSRIERELYPASGVSTKTVDGAKPFIKLHMRDGTVYIFSRWSVTAQQDTIFGQGIYRDINRENSLEGNFRIPITSIALIETNRISENPATIGLGIVTGISIAVTIACITNPKACFGSCPTFYVYDGNEFILQAEGFSASIAPSLEATDVDALYRAKPNGSILPIRLTNEALETHVIRFANVLAIPRPDNGRVFQTPSGEFIQATKIIEPLFCRAPEGDCTNALREFDADERFSKTDSSDLCSKESIELVFDASKISDAALVIGCRQTLLTTFLLYQAFGYMGTRVGEILSQIDRGDSVLQSQIMQFGMFLGGIEVLIENKEGQWSRVGEIGETGPIATDVVALPLPRNQNSGQIKLRLLMTKGMWRINYVALASVEKKVEPLRIKPIYVTKDDLLDTSATKCLRDNVRPLVTLPGDVYTIVYQLPEEYEKYELFLESRGYYLEWMRKEWLQEENPARVIQLLTNTRQFVKDLSPKFKQIESTMEESFWRSRYVHQ